MEGREGRGEGGGLHLATLKKNADVGESARSLPRVYDRDCTLSEQAA